jgi:hypothetical protein
MRKSMPVALISASARSSIMPGNGGVIRKTVALIGVEDVKHLRN